MEQTKKTTLAYAPDVDFKPNTRMRLNSNNASRSDVEFEPISGSNTVRLNSKTVRLNSNNTSRSEQVKRSGNYFYTTGRQTDSRMKGMMKEDEGKQLDKQITPFNEEKDPYSLDFVLQDIDNNRIQVYIKKELIYMYEPLFVEGQCYQISNFGVAENGGKLPLLPHKFKIAFHKNTTVTRIDHIDDNMKGFVFDNISTLGQPK
nr:hypothetical protein [Tanacetum cinerariifolium]